MWCTTKPCIIFTMTTINFCGAEGSDVQQKLKGKSLGNRARNDGNEGRGLRMWLLHAAVAVSRVSFVNRLMDSRLDAEQDHRVGDQKAAGSSERIFMQ